MNQRTKKPAFPKRLVSTVLAAVMVMASYIPAEASFVTTSVSSLPVSSNEAYVTASINTASGTRTYNVFNQFRFGRNRKDYIPAHGCAVCSLTTVLSGYKSRYATYTPNTTRFVLEKAVFGKSAWKKNYSKSINGQMPVTLYGISRILKKCGIRNKYVSSFSSDNKVYKVLTSHLRKGEAVVIETNNRRQKNGRISSSYDSKWARSRHTMVLLGLTENGNVIVADSANRDWAGGSQRIKLASLKDLIAHMVPHSPSGKSLYYNGSKCYSGYILVNP